MLLKTFLNLKTKLSPHNRKPESLSALPLTQQNVRTLKRLAQKFVPAVRLYIHSDEIQSTVTELDPLTQRHIDQPVPFRCSRPHSPFKVKGGAVAFAKGRGKPPLNHRGPR